MATGQTIMPRDVAAIPAVDPNAAVHETAIAAGDGRTIAVFHVLPKYEGGLQQIGYAIAEESGGSWSWVEDGLIDPNTYTDRSFTDPSVAYDSVTGDFLVAAVARKSGVWSIVVARFDASTETFGDWEEICTDTLNDKPWIVAGEVGELPAFGPFDPIEYQEFYIAWQGDGNLLRYAHSLDGGYTWVSSPNCNALTDVDDPNSVISLGRVPVPRVYADRPLYVLTAAGDFDLTVFRGNDVTTGAHAGEVKFTRLLSSATGNPPLVVPRYTNTGDTPYLTPMPNGAGPSGNHGGPGIDLAVDPTDADKLYVVYHDTQTWSRDPNCVPDPNTPCEYIAFDLNIYMTILSHTTGAKWTVGSRILVADDSSGEVETDQFLPAVDVDPNGVIHVIYYDDRDFEQDDDDTETQFDVYYSWSASQGGSWSVRELCDDPNNSCANTEPAVDFTLQSNFALRDYIGIDAVAGQVWTSFMGSSSARDAYDDKSIIWSTLIFP